MEYLAEKSTNKRAKKAFAMTSIFDEIIHKYSQNSSLDSMQPGQVIKGTDGVSYTVVKDNTSGEKFFAPAQGQPGQQTQQTQQEQQVQQPQDPSQQNQDPNQYAMQPNNAVKPEDENKPEPMGAKTSQNLQGLTDQDWADIGSMGSDISQYAQKKDMRGIMEILEDLTDFTLTFVNLPEDL